ncbi:MAG: tyrosine-type recombinase/integrase [Gammaproteobacteria bacterium]
MLNQAIDSYIEIRRAAGFELKVVEGLLHNFARFTADRSEDHVQRQTAIDWAAQAPSPYQRERRLSMVRGFAQHARAEDPSHDRIPRHVFAHPRRRPSRYIFSPDELCQLLDATARLRPKGSLRSHTYYTLFGLLATTGLRISEALHLVLSDITTDGLVVRKTKFRKSRLVPLHETTAAALKRYLDRRQALHGGDDHVFSSTKGGALSYAMVNGTFHFLMRSIDLRSKPGLPHPRIHDLRHYFAVRALESCHGGRDAVARHILALSTYLGHAHVTDTYWYLQATPHLMTGIAEACEAFNDGGAP